MRKTTLYSSSRRSTLPAPIQQRSDNTTPDTELDREQPLPPIAAASSSSVREFCRRHARALSAVCVLLGVTLFAVSYELKPTTREITQEDINAAVLHTLETNVLPSATSKAYEIIRPSVVRVRRLEPGKNGGEDKETGVGSGVVIVDKGVILTNLHVVAGATRVQVVFADGTESEATVTSTQPENDLAVLQAHTLPDDLVAATLRSTADLMPGDQVVAVGFPFGIGPSASAGVVSGLRRAFRSPEGKRVLTNLIQFDAAVNPGSSGGPLVTARGEVVGIVTALLNPTDQRFFVGIGFAVPIENAASAVGIPPF